MAAGRKPRMNANERQLILKAEVHAVVGCAMEVLNELGHGLHEKIFANSPFLHGINDLRRISRTT